MAKTKAGGCRTYEEIGQALGRPPATVRYWAKNGAPIVKGRLNDLDAIRNWLASWEQTNPPKGGTQLRSDNARQLAEAKLALEVQQRRRQNELLQLKLARARAELIPVADAAEEIAAMARSVRQRMLAIPGAVAEKLVGLDRRAIDRILREEIERALLAASLSLSSDSGSPPPRN